MQPTIKCEELPGEYALLPGDPQRAKFISGLLDDSREIAKNREFWTYTGIYRGIEVVITSTGIGGPSTAMVVSELSQLGINTFIRVGTCGYIDPKVKAGDLVIVDSAIRKDGTSLFSAPIEYPAVANHEVLEALTKASQNLERPCHQGTVLTADSFYEIKPWLEKFKMALAFEMECAPLFVKCSVNGLKAGAILAVDGKAGDVGAISRYTRGEKMIREAVREETGIALEAVRILTSKAGVK
ncbi:MAG: nucleoside phosphorylase [Candidatus Hadarchaeota archaeon]|nr:nucleoside phosphorylase [Candidatus Hadarchaeota archaeon]